DPPADRCASGREAQCDDARGAAGMKESRGSVLFLDDDPPILNGLRMRLHRFDGQWEMRFTDCGEDALAELERWEADVVVSDVRMPGMDGVEFQSSASGGRIRSGSRFRVLPEWSRSRSSCPTR